MSARHASAAQLERILPALRGVLGYELGRPEHERPYPGCDHDDAGRGCIAPACRRRRGARAGRARRRPRRGWEYGADSGAGSASDETTHIGD
jgi:hypothetical protein